MLRKISLLIAVITNGFFDCVRPTLSESFVTNNSKLQPRPVNRTTHGKIENGSFIRSDPIIRTVKHARIGIMYIYFLLRVILDCTSDRVCTQDNEIDLKYSVVIMSCDLRLIYKDFV